MSALTTRVVTCSTVHFRNNLTNKAECFNTKATIIDSDFDLIIGRVSIFEHDLS